MTHAFKYRLLLLTILLLHCYCMHRALWAELHRVRYTLRLPFYSSISTTITIGAAILFRTIPVSFLTSSLFQQWLLDSILVSISNTVLVICWAAEMTKWRSIYIYIIQIVSKINICDLHDVIFQIYIQVHSFRKRLLLLFFCFITIST